MSGLTNSITSSSSTVFPSADLDQAVNWTALGVFENAGQSCSAGSRVLVHESILGDFEEKIKVAAESIKVCLGPDR